MKTCEEWARDIEAKIESEKTKRKERNNMKNKYMKLGAVAACLVLVIGAAAVIPYVANRNESANLPETTVAATEPAQTGDAIGGGESSMCKVHHNSYHSIPLELSTYAANKAGAEKVDEWFEEKWDMTNNPGVDICRTVGFNIIEFLRDFNITKEEFVEELTFLVKAEYDADVLYSEDEALIEEYFTDWEAREGDSSRIGNYATLTGELNIMYAEKMGIDIADAPRLPVSDIVLKLGMEREELEAFIKKNYDMVIENDPSSKQFDYDLDGLYGEDTDEKYSLEIDPEESVYERWVRLDALFCGME